jgi:hypothetical protein
LRDARFPPPIYPDELLYSACARFSDRLRYPSGKAAADELFGTTSATAVTDFPSRLRFLAGNISPCSPYTVNRLIDEHTLFPFFSAFLPPECALSLREDMTGENGSAIHMRSGVMAGRIPQPRWLRFCPTCAAQD